MTITLEVHNDQGMVWAWNVSSDPRLDEALESARGIIENLTPEVPTHWHVCDGTSAGLNEAVGGDCTVQFDWGAPVSIRFNGKQYVLPANAILGLMARREFQFHLNEDGTVTWRDILS